MPRVISKRAFRNIPRAALLLAAISAAPSAFGQTTVAATWVGVSSSEGGVWSTASLWNPQQVPNNNASFVYNVVIPNNGNIGPSLEAAVTINNLSLLDGMNMSANTGAPANLTVLGSTILEPTIVNTVPVYGGMEIRNSTYSLGNFSAFSGGVLLGGNFRIERGSGDAILQFNGADIVENRANLELSGNAVHFGNALIKDQVSGLDGLRNFAKNTGALDLLDGRQLATAGSFNNSGFINIFGASFVDPAVRSTLTVNGNLTNSGQIRLYGSAATGAGRMVVTGNVINSGDIFFHGDSASFEATGTFTQSAGQIILGEGSGSIETFRMTAKRIDMAAGTTFGGRGTLLADLVEGGIFAPGASPGIVTVEGDITFQSTATLKIEVGGLLPGTGYDQVIQETQSGGLGTTLDGLLDIAMYANFQNSISPSDTFAILDSDLVINGAFDNVASGQRLATSDGLGSFLVTYAGLTDVILSNFQPVPEPAALSGVLAGAAMLVARRRRN